MGWNMIFLASTSLTAIKQTVMPKKEVVVKQIVWENSRHFKMPPLVPPWNDIWETSTEIHNYPDVGSDDASFHGETILAVFSGY